MGAYDGAVVCELIGIYMSFDRKNMIFKKYWDMYR